MTDLQEAYDYIVVGAGSAGAVVAARLTEDPNTTVLLVEAGPEDTSVWTRMPAGFAKTIFNDKYMWWNYQTEPEPALGGTQYPLPRGKVVGGSGAINGLVHLRGAPLDYETWVDKGATGWGYDEVLPYFKKSERDVRGDTEFHSGRGPFGVEPARWKNPLADAFINTAVSALGIPHNKDFNSADIEGAGYWDLATWKGVRSSPSRAYIHPNRKRPNLTVLTEAFVSRVEFEGKRATGVAIEQSWQVRSVKANREVILSAGALHTPQLLQVSGIGPGNLLQKFGIPVVHDAPGVGENLMDHMQIDRRYSTSSTDTFNKKANGALAQGKSGIRYLATRKGPLAIGAALAGAHIYTHPSEKAPDLQFHYMPFVPGDKGYLDMAPFSGFRILMCKNRPVSRGHVRITSADPRVSPEFEFNHLSDESDAETFIAGMKLAKKIADAMPAEFNVREVEPGPDADISDDALLDYIKSNADTVFHYCGTARMGADAEAVVDPQLRVRGVEGLRVIDASVMPTIVSGNIHAAVLMIGEKGADLIKKG